MNSYNEHQQYLMMAGITGDLSNEEKNELELFFQNYPDAKKEFERIKSLFPEQDIATGFSRFREPGKWKDVPGLIKKESKVKRLPIIQKWMAAAVIIAIGIGSWIFFFNKPGIQNKQVADIIKPAVLLQLANGKIINLSSTTGSLNTENIILNNSNQVLSYSSTGEMVSGTNSLTVPVGMEYQVSLEDGTQLWLNAATKLDFPFRFSGGSREININGEAYIKVSKDAKRPFIVHLPNSDVEVLGTEFNVNTYDSGIVKVALVEGAVNLQSPGAEIKLYPGKEGVYENNERLYDRVFDAKRTLSWRQGLFYFQKASLAEISSVLPRWYGIRVVLDNPDIEVRKFTGVLDKKQPIQVFMEDIKLISGIESYIDKDKVLHFK